MAILPAMNPFEALLHRQLSARHALVLSLRRAFSTQVSLWSWLGYGLGYGVIVSLFNLRHRPENWMQTVPFSFLTSIFFSGFITITYSFPWRVRLVPRRFSSRGPRIFGAVVFSLVLGPVFFFLSLLGSALSVYGTEKLGHYIGGYAQNSVWGLVYTLVSLPIALGEILDRRGRLSRAREKRLTRLAEEARAIALRAQINPHFFFNALNTIAALIPSQPAEAERAVELLAESLRPVLTREQPLLGTVESEFSIARAYGEIECLRHGPRLRIEFDPEPSVAGFMVPSLSLQPLLENAILHGASRTAEPFHIRLTAQRMGGHVCLEVTGALVIGATESGPGVLVESQSGHALENIQLRAKALFGPEARLEVSVHDHHCSVARLLLPATGPLVRGART